MSTMFKTAAPPESVFVADTIRGIYSLRLLLDVYDVGTFEPVANGVQFTLPPDVATDAANVVRVVISGHGVFSVMVGKVAGLEFVEAGREDGLPARDLHLAIGDRVTGRR